MTDVILQSQMTSASVRFPRAFKTVNYLRNRSALAVNCSVVGLFTVSRSVVKKIKSGARSASDISSYNLLTNSELFLSNSRTGADLFRFKHTINVENTFEVFSFFQLSAIALKNSRQYLDYVAYVFMYL